MNAPLIPLPQDEALLEALRKNATPLAPSPRSDALILAASRRAQNQWRRNHFIKRSAVFLTATVACVACVIYFFIPMVQSPNVDEINVSQMCSEILPEFPSVEEEMLLVNDPSDAVLSRWITAISDE